MINYRTHYDRRHNVNVIVTYSAGPRRQWEFSGRWNFGTGFPFTQLGGFYEHYQFENMNDNFLLSSGDLGLIYSDLNGGQLPTYHRLDIDVKRKFYFTENILLEADFSITNVYNRNNIFYIDLLTGEEIYQLPLMPSFGLTLSF